MRLSGFIGFLFLFFFGLSGINRASPHFEHGGEGGVCVFFFSFSFGG